MLGEDGQELRGVPFTIATTLGAASNHPCALVIGKLAVANRGPKQVANQSAQTFLVILGDGGAQKAAEAGPLELPFLKTPGRLRGKLAPPHKGSQDGGSQIFEKSLGVPVPERDEIALGGEDPVRYNDVPMRVEREDGDPLLDRLDQSLRAWPNRFAAWSVR